MNEEINQLYLLIKRFRLDWRHPEELSRVVRRIERGLMRPQQARRWLKKIGPWIEQQRRCFNPFPPAPDQEELGQFDVELGELVENPGVRIGVRLIQQAGRHLLISGLTGSGKSTILRRLIDGIDTINRNAMRFHNDPGS